MKKKYESKPYEVNQFDVIQDVLVKTIREGSMSQFPGNDMPCENEVTPGDRIKAVYALMDFIRFRKEMDL